MSTPWAEPLPGSEQTVDGLRVHRVLAGEGEPTIVFLHGIPTSSYLWRNVQRPLADRHRTVAPDLVGLGASDRPDDDRVRLERQADTMVRLLDDLGIDRFVLVAHDIGGAVAHHMAARHGDRLRALVVMNAVAFRDSWPVPIVKAMRAPVLGEISSLIPSRALMKRELRRGVHHTDRMSGEVFERYYRPVSGLSGRRAFLRFIRGMDAESAEASLMESRDLDVPRLILWGEEDPFQPIRFGRRLYELWPGSRFVAIAEAGHFLQEDQPERIAHEIDAFLHQSLTGS